MRKIGRSASKSGRTRIGERSASKRYTVCISPWGGISSTSHERVARDRETGLSKLSKIPGWCSRASPLGGCPARKRHAGWASLFSRSLFTVTYVTRREPLSPLASPRTIARDTIRSRWIRAYRMGACKNSVIACVAHAQAEVVHLPSREIVSWESLLLSETLTRNH